MNQQNSHQNFCIAWGLRANGQLIEMRDLCILAIYVLFDQICTRLLLRIVALMVETLKERKNS